MKNWKYFIVFCLMSAMSVNNIKAEKITFKVEINNVTKGGGKIYVGIYNNENSYKSTIPDIKLQHDANKTTIIVEVTLPEGEYVINAYQDSNGNGKLDFGFFNIPKEPSGITNYNGKGIPGNFNKLKVKVDKNTQKITVNLY